MPDPRHVHVTEWLDAIVEKGRNLTRWEDEFVDSIENQINAHGSQFLSGKQINIIERIYTDKT